MLRAPVLTAGVLVALAAGSATAGGTAGDTQLDPATRGHAVFSGHLQGVCPAYGPQAPVPCSAGAADSRTFRLTLTEAAAQRGRLSVNVASALTNAGLSIRLYDGAGHLVAATSGLVLRGYPGGRMQSEADLSAGELAPGTYTVALAVTGGVADYTETVDWAARAVSAA